MQIWKQPIQIRIKQMLTFNYRLLKSVRMTNYYTQIFYIDSIIFFFFQSRKLCRIIICLFQLKTFQTIVLTTVYIAILIQFQIAEENASTHVKNN